MAPLEHTATLTRRLIVAAWMSIGLALAIEIALLAATAAFDTVHDLRPFIADLAGKVSWSVPVCVGIAVGMVASAARAPVMGLLGFLSAPAAFALAKAAHKSVAQALDITITAPVGGPSAGQMVVLRAVEYAVLGLAVGLLSRRGGRLAGYAALGLGTGIAAAAFVLWMTVHSSPSPPALVLLSKGINEVLFPLGCSMVLYAANALGERVRIAVAA